MAQKKLATYQARRDFKKTSGPTAKVSIQRAGYPRFIIQKRTASCVMLRGWPTPFRALGGGPANRPGQLDSNRTVRVYEHAAR